MSSVLLEYGNIARGMGDLPWASHVYKDCLTLTTENTPENTIIICILYKLGGVRYDLDDFNGARIYLDQAMQLARQYNSEGDIARIAYKQSQVIKQLRRSGETDKQLKLDVMAETLKRKLYAEQIKRKLEMEGVTAHEGDDVERAYNRLVCSFFR